VIVREVALGPSGTGDPSESDAAVVADAVVSLARRE
jgi:hypothetical protein